MYDAFISFFFFFNDTATTEIYTLSLHDALPIFVTAAGLGAIAWVLWYFLFKRGGGPAVAASLADGVQEVHVTVKGGYTPDTIVVQAGKPVRLQVYRGETADCSGGPRAREFRPALGPPGVPAAHG